MGITYSAPRADEDFNGNDAPGVFLAGTIDMGNSKDWQSIVSDSIGAAGNNANIFNPRRVCYPDDKEEIKYQIRWELSRIKESHIVFFNFLPDSKSPVTFLELGICLAGAVDKDTVLIVVCPPEFYRYDNIQITCEEWGVKIHHSFEEGVRQLHNEIEAINEIFF